MRLSRPLQQERLPWICHARSCRIRVLLSEPRLGGQNALELDEQLLVLVGMHGGFAIKALLGILCTILPFHRKPRQFKPGSEGIIAKPYRAKLKTRHIAVTASRANFVVKVNEFHI